jgi:hypothetical protein
MPYHTAIHFCDERYREGLGSDGPFGNPGLCKRAIQATNTNVRRALFKLSADGFNPAANGFLGFYESITDARLFGNYRRAQCIHR